MIFCYRLQTLEIVGECLHAIGRDVWKEFLLFPTKIFSVDQEGRQVIIAITHTCVRRQLKWMTQSKSLSSPVLALLPPQLRSFAFVAALFGQFPFNLRRPPLLRSRGSDTVAE